MNSLHAVPAIEGKIHRHTVVIVGAGQAGMSMSYHLSQRNIDHVLIEKNDMIAENWKKERWDSFCLVTPNWQCQLPGHHYKGDDPNGFMVKDEIVEYLESYYNTYKPPVRFGRQVAQLIKKDGQFHIFTNAGEIYICDQAVLACGSYHRINIPSFANEIAEDVFQVHSRDYKNAEQLPDGEVLVVGTGQSGAQIAEDIHLSGKKVHLCVGPAPRVNRRYRGKDVVDWLEEMGYYDTTIENHPDGKNAPHSTNHYVTGRDGGRDLNLRIFAEQGMQLYGKLSDIKNNTLHIEDNLKQSLDYADHVAKRIRDSIEEYIVMNNISAPQDENLHSDFTPPYKPEVSLTQQNIKSVVWATGFRMQFDWVKLPVLSEQGHPINDRGITAEAGLYFLGLNWMHTWGSGRFFHVGKDAEFLAARIEAQVPTKTSQNKNSEAAALA